jgi:hypothetical protein
MLAKSNLKMETKMLKGFIGLGIPYIAIIGLLPYVASVDRFIFGVPFIYMWIFSWFILTSACLYTVWYLFDRHEPDLAQEVD